MILTDPSPYLLVGARDPSLGDVTREERSEVMLEEIKKLWAAATKAPWKLGPMQLYIFQEHPTKGDSMVADAGPGDGADVEEVVAVTVAGEAVEDVVVRGDLILRLRGVGSGKDLGANGAAIAAAPEHIAWLVAKLEEAMCLIDKGSSIIARDIERVAELKRGIAETALACAAIADTYRTVTTEAMALNEVAVVRLATHADENMREVAATLAELVEDKTLDALVGAK